ncbi:MAG: DUF1847 domain-containing protein [Spirochaetales bacterium]|nr:DUF1847 domain-containing protein [Spirochaetales bacterium]
MSNSANLYDQEDLKIMAGFDSLSDMSTNRIQLIRDLAHKTGAKKIGIAHCITFRREAQAIEDYLSKYFTVYRVDCKHGARDISYPCNPAGQADYLNGNDCDYNISIGLCVGHDMIFNKKSEAYVTNIFSKDFTNNNSPEAALASISRS